MAFGILAQRNQVFAHFADLHFHLGHSGRQPIDVVQAILQIFDSGVGLVLNVEIVYIAGNGRSDIIINYLYFINYKLFGGFYLLGIVFEQSCELGVDDFEV